MFVHAIEVAGAFTRPIHMITRTYGSQLVVPGAATVFLVNAEGWALTCAHVAREIIAAEQIRANYAAFKGALATPPAGRTPKAWRKDLEKKHGLTQDSIADRLITFLDCADFKQFHVRLHPTADVALVRFDQFTKLSCTSFPVFAADGEGLKQGKSLCRLGFPFPEFENFAYDPGQDALSWTEEGRRASPRFPIEGMLTRHLMGPEGLVGFELSTPGLRGQSGGPTFDTEGRVWGMQSSTAHLDLHFDVDQQVVRGGTKRRVSDHAFLHVGRCVHVDVLKAFMRKEGVQFDEG
jgi:hypothetical protein